MGNPDEAQMNNIDLGGVLNLAAEDTLNIRLLSFALALIIKPRQEETLNTRIGWWKMFFSFSQHQFSFQAVHVYLYL